MKVAERLSYESPPEIHMNLLLPGSLIKKNENH